MFDDIFTLISKYSLADILVFIAIAAAAIKGVACFVDWMAAGKKAVVETELEKKQKNQLIERRFNEEDSAIKELKDNQKNMTDTLNMITEKINLLLDSDRDDIKSFLTEKHHYFMNQGWIDDYSLECCEKRYQHYRDEGGNSFIETFMKEIRQLPKTKVPPMV